MSTTTVLVSRPVEDLAREAGMHPDLARRLLGFGLVPGPPYPLGTASVLARAARLRRDLGLNYAGAVLACELLARIEDLEARLRAAEGRPPRHEVRTWTRTS
jgi:hypothetical protein